MFQVASLKGFLVSSRGGSSGTASAPSGNLPLVLSGAEVWPDPELGGGGSLFEPAALHREDAGWGFSHNWLFETLAATTPTREVPAVPPPSPSAPRP